MPLCLLCECCNVENTGQQESSLPFLRLRDFVRGNARIVTLAAASPWKEKSLNREQQLHMGSVQPTHILFLLPKNEQLSCDPARSNEATKEISQVCRYPEIKKNGRIDFFFFFLKLTTWGKVMNKESTTIQITRGVTGSVGNGSVLGIGRWG